MSKKLVAIDASTAKTGVSCFVCKNYSSHHLIDFSKMKDIDVRFKSMCISIWDLLNELKPNVIYIEDTYMANNAATMRILTRIQGVVYAWCINNDCEFNTITPKAWRKKLEFKQGNNFKRKEQKEQSVKYVSDNCNLIVSDDEADAICIGLSVLK